MFGNFVPDNTNEKIAISREFGIGSKSSILSGLGGQHLSTLAFSREVNVTILGTSKEGVPGVNKNAFEGSADGLDLRSRLRTNSRTQVAHRQSRVIEGEEVGEADGEMLKERAMGTSEDSADSLMGLFKRDLLGDVEDGSGVKNGLTKVLAEFPE